RLHRNPVDDFELNFADGRWLRVSERRTGDGGCVSIRTDITALKQRQEDLSSQQQRADSANKAKTDFLLTMSHELRTPLNAIMGFSEVMKQQLRGPLGDVRYVDYANDIYDSASHLLAVINNILDISRIEAGRLELDEQAVVIGDEIDKALRQLEEEARGADVKLASDIEQDLPLLLGDAHKIQQIVINLVGNAVRYMPDSGKVTVQASRQAEGGIVLKVEDDGAGMSAEDVERVISPFVRLSNPMVRAHDGTGLGLPLVKALVELHGGQFTLTSKIGKGTTGTAIFPKSRVIQPEDMLLQDGSG
ncbi:MAG: HAMP domain-containing sensor histidine kinase, partial [Pseudomonadota bacterium]